MRKQRGPLIFQQRDMSYADLIIGVDDIEVRSVDDFLSYIESKSPGDTVIVRIIRGGESMDVRITLGGDEPVLPARNGRNI